MIPWFETPIIFDVRAKPRNIASLTGTKGKKNGERVEGGAIEFANGNNKIYKWSTLLAVSCPSLASTSWLLCIVPLGRTMTNVFCHRL